MVRSVFISYATIDRKEALAVCEAIERRGTRCWIACRDVQPGENYQEAIVRAIRTARAMVLVFSDHANNSDEIKKELSLVSRFGVPLMALRIEDVEPSDAFAYELATRQWIDLFEDWDKSLDSLVRRVEEIAPRSADGETPEARAPEPVLARPIPARPAPARTMPKSEAKPFPTKIAAFAAAALLLVVAAIGGWSMLGSGSPAEKSMDVRLTGFAPQTKDIPEGMPNALRDEIIAAFSDDGVVGVSTATSPPNGTAPAYALGGSIGRDGDQITVITVLKNEHSGSTLWSHKFSYDAKTIDRVPRRIAIDAGMLVRCGLFGASTYPKAVPDAVLTDYLSVCHNLGEIEFQPTKALDLARKVVAALPDFSWGWSAVGIAAGMTAVPPDGPENPALLKEALAAIATAIKLDPSNSEAITAKAFLIDPYDLTGREALLKQALDARALACGCEHHSYGNFLEEVGRIDDAIVEFRRGVDILALNAGTQASLGIALAATGRSDDAKSHLDTAVELSGDPRYRNLTTVYLATTTRDYKGAIKALDDLPGPLPAATKAALIEGFRALDGGSPSSRAAAISSLAALSSSGQSNISRELMVMLLGALGGNMQLFDIISKQDGRHSNDARDWLFYPDLAGVRADPRFASVAEKLGLLRYWRTSKTRPDFCKAADAPAICRTI